MSYETEVENLRGRIEVQENVAAIAADDLLHWAENYAEAMRSLQASRAELMKLREAELLRMRAEVG